MEKSYKTDRRSIRLKDYDYTKSGLYFITICTQNRLNLFGEIINGEMVLNDAGRIVDNEIIVTEQIRENVIIHNRIVMPNHIHFIMEITCRGDAVGSPISDNCKKSKQSNRIQPNSVGSIIGQIKSISTKRCNQMMEMNNNDLNGYGTYEDGRATGKPIQWQRNYYEHIIRNETEYNNISNYITNNPSKWENDKLNGGSGNIVMESISYYGVGDINC